MGRLIEDIRLCVCFMCFSTVCIAGMFVSQVGGVMNF